MWPQVFDDGQAQNSGAAQYLNWAVFFFEKTSRKSSIRRLQA